MLATQDIKVKLKSRASELGFSDLRVCSADDFSESDAHMLRNWLRLGMNADMRYLERAYAMKISPRAFFPAANSAIVVCANFKRESPEHRIALYAQGPDYHDIIKPKLADLSKILEDAGGIQKFGVDASPLWEKALAVRAGIGWRGKNTLVIRAENGPWNFLGVILTTIRLDFDPPADNRCADCNACIMACPTRALGACGLDARKCVSYLTIEKKGDLGESEKALAGNTIFGCDICLRACPFGRNAPKPAIPDFGKILKLPENPTNADILEAARSTPMARKFKRGTKI